MSFQITPETSVAQFGYVNTDSYTGSMQYHTQVPQKNTWWTLNLSGVQYGNQDIKVSNWKYAIVDSGTRMIYMSHPDYLNFVK